MKPMTERHVQAIWYDVSLRPERLYTRHGSEVRVLSPGEWNLGPGPDFRNAVLEVGREHRRVAGDVEIHLCPSDWDFHRHGADPRYRNVIAHVTWGCGPEPSTLPPGALSIWIGRFVTANPTFSFDAIDLMAYPYAKLPTSERPCEGRIAHDPDLAREILSEAGRHRLRMKSRRLAGRLAERASGGAPARRQIFYEEVMTALGYKNNASQFRHVAERVPLEELPRDESGAETALLTAATFEEWNLSCSRPHNLPETRLANAARVFTETESMALISASDFGEVRCREMVETLCGGRERRMRCMGRGRAAAVIANVIAPFAMAEGRLSGLPEWLPPEDISQPVRLTAFRLFGRDHNPAAFYSTNGLLIQGLLQIHRDYCLQLHPACERCRLGDRHRAEAGLPFANRPRLPDYQRLV